MQSQVEVRKLRFQYELSDSQFGNEGDHLSSYGWSDASDAMLNAENALRNNSPDDGDY